MRGWNAIAKRREQRGRRRCSSGRGEHTRMPAAHPPLQRHVVCRYGGLYGAELLANLTSFKSRLLSHVWTSFDPSVPYLAGYQRFDPFAAFVSCPHDMPLTAFGKDDGKKVACDSSSVGCGDDRARLDATDRVSAPAGACVCRCFATSARRGRRASSTHSAPMEVSERVRAASRQGTHGSPRGPMPLPSAARLFL